MPRLTPRMMEPLALTLSTCGRISPWLDRCNTWVINGTGGSSERSLSRILPSRSPFWPDKLAHWASVIRDSRKWRITSSKWPCKRNVDVNANDNNNNNNNEKKKFFFKRMCVYVTPSSGDSPVGIDSKSRPRNHADQDKPRLNGAAAFAFGVRHSSRRCPGGRGPPS